jgi:hypothetical protein
VHSVNFAAKLVHTWPDVPFPVLLSTLIRSRFQAKPATFLIPIDFPFLFAVQELYGTRYQSGSFSLINVGSGFHCLRSFSFFPLRKKILDWVFPTQQNLPTRHKSHPDGMLVMSTQGRGRHLDPKQVPTRNRGMHLVELKLCSNKNPQQTLENAHKQHQPLIQHLRTRSLRGISRNNTFHVILLGVGGTIYNHDHIFLLSLGIPPHKVRQLATTLHCHAIKSLYKITKTRQNNP